jgi:hypothetical protein
MYLQRARGGMSAYMQEDVRGGGHAQLQVPHSGLVVDVCKTDRLWTQHHSSGSL